MCFFHQMFWFFTYDTCFTTNKSDIKNMHKHIKLVCRACDTCMICHAFWKFWTNNVTNRSSKKTANIRRFKNAKGTSHYDQKYSHKLHNKLNFYFKLYRQLFYLKQTKNWPSKCPIARHQNWVKNHFPNSVQNNIFWNNIITKPLYNVILQFDIYIQN